MTSTYDGFDSHTEKIVCFAVELESVGVLGET